MANILINIKEYEKINVLNAVRILKDNATSVDKIASKTDVSPNRVRFIIEDLLDEGRLVRTVTKALNPRYIRYQYALGRPKNESNDSVPS